MKAGPVILAGIVVALGALAGGIGFFVIHEQDEKWGEPARRPLFNLTPATEPRVFPGPVIPREGIGGPEELAAENPYTGNAHAIQDGARLFLWMNCNGCHGEGGGSIGPPLWDASWTYGGSPSEIAESILRGRLNGMPAFGGRLTEDQVWRIVAYLQSLEPGGSLTNAGEK